MCYGALVELGCVASSLRSKVVFVGGPNTSFHTLPFGALGGGLFCVCNATVCWGGDRLSCIRCSLNAGNGLSGRKGGRRQSAGLPRGD